MHRHQRNLIVIVVILAAVALSRGQQSDVLHIFGEGNGNVAYKRVVPVGTALSLLIYVVFDAVEESFDILEL